MVEPADSQLLRDTAAMADKLKSLLVPYGASVAGWDNWAARLEALAVRLVHEERADHALTEVEHGDMGVVARFRRVSEARKHVREVMDGVTFDRGYATYHWQLGPVLTTGPMSVDTVRINVRHPLPPPNLTPKRTP